LAHHDDALALAGPVLRQPQIAAVLLMIGRLAVASEVGGVSFALNSFTAQKMPGLLGLQAFPKLVQQHEGDLVVAADFAGQLKSRQALTALTNRKIASSRSPNFIFRSARIVPAVTLNS
jgi:hypothetical protein